MKLLKQTNNSNGQALMGLMMAFIGITTLTYFVIGQKEIGDRLDREEKDKQIVVKQFNEITMRANNNCANTFNGNRIKVPTENSHDHIPEIIRDDVFGFFGHDPNLGINIGESSDRFNPDIYEGVGAKRSIMDFDVGSLNIRYNAVQCIDMATGDAANLNQDGWYNCVYTLIVVNQEELSQNGIYHTRQFPLMIKTKTISPEASVVTDCVAMGTNQFINYFKDVYQADTDLEDMNPDMNIFTKKLTETCEPTHRYDISTGGFLEDVLSNATCDGMLAGNPKDSNANPDFYPLTDFREDLDSFLDTKLYSE